MDRKRGAQEKSKGPPERTGVNISKKSNKYKTHSSVGTGSFNVVALVIHSI